MEGATSHFYCSHLAIASLLMHGMLMLHGLREVAWRRHEALARSMSVDRIIFSPLQREEDSLSFFFGCHLERYSAPMLSWTG